MLGIYNGNGIEHSHILRRNDVLRAQMRCSAKYECLEEMPVYLENYADERDFRRARVRCGVSYAVLEKDGLRIEIRRKKILERNEKIRKYEERVARKELQFHYSDAEDDSNAALGDSQTIIVLSDFNIASSEVDSSFSTGSSVESSPCSSSADSADLSD